MDSQRLLRHLIRCTWRPTCTFLHPRRDNWLLTRKAREKAQEG